MPFCLSEEAPPPPFGIQEARVYEHLLRYPLPLTRPSYTAFGWVQGMMVPQLPEEMPSDFPLRLFELNMGTAVSDMIMGIRWIHSTGAGPNAFVDPWRRWDDAWLLKYREGLTLLRTQDREYLQTAFLRYMFTWRGHAYALMLEELGRLYGRSDPAPMA